MKRPFIAAFILSFVFLISADSLLAGHVNGYSRKDGTYVSGYDRGGSSGGGLPSWADMGDYWFWVILIIFVVVALMVAVTIMQGKRVTPKTVQ